MHDENLKQDTEKLETELLFLKDVNIETSFQFKEWYFESLEQNKTKKNRESCISVRQ